MPNKLASQDAMADSCVHCLWTCLPDNLLLNIFEYLSLRNVLDASQVCYQWHRIAFDEFLWRDLFYRHFKINRAICMAPGMVSWQQEFKRLWYHSPSVESEVLREHRDQVLHVSFAHNGQFFATTSKDGFIKVWNSTYPCSLKYEADMKEYTWKYTQFSQFNNNDTLLLVSGVHFGAQTTSGEIAVFNLVAGFDLQCRVLNKPYDIFGAWYNSGYLLSGNLYWRGNFSSSSLLWLNKASQALESEHESVVKRLYHFLNHNASSIRTILVASCPESTEHDINVSISSHHKRRESLKASAHHYVCPSSLMECSRAKPQFRVGLPLPGNKKSHRNRIVEELDSRSVIEFAYVHWMAAEEEEAASLNDWFSDNSENDDEEMSAFNLKHSENVTEENYDDDCKSKMKNNLTSLNQLHDVLASANYVQTDSVPACKEVMEGRIEMELDKVKTEIQEETKVEIEKVQLKTTDLSKLEKTVSESITVDDDFCDKYLIFTMGEKTYTPHQIGIKKIEGRKAHEIIEGLKHREDRRLDDDDDQLLNADEKFDSVDHTVELHGHIIGMCLSPDHRFLYVNSRAWPKGYEITDPLSPPPIAQEIDIHVIDLQTLQEVGNLLQSHKAFTPNDECFFIFLDVSSQYIASGAEDKHGYLWDRHYGICLRKFLHNDVVNSVAFNPQDPEVLVTVSDDFSIKIWRSINREQEVKSKQFIHINNPEVVCPQMSA